MKIFTAVLCLTVGLLISMLAIAAFLTHYTIYGLFLVLAFSALFYAAYVLFQKPSKKVDKPQRIPFRSKHKAEPKHLFRFQLMALECLEILNKSKDLGTVKSRLDVLKNALTELAKFVDCSNYLTVLRDTIIHYNEMYYDRKATHDKIVIVENPDKALQPGLWDELQTQVLVEAFRHYGLHYLDDLNTLKTERGKKARINKVLAEYENFIFQFPYLKSHPLMLEMLGVIQNMRDGT